MDLSALGTLGCVEYNFHSALVTGWALCHIRKRLFLRYGVGFVSTIFGCSQ